MHRTQCLVVLIALLASIASAGADVPPSLALAVQLMHNPMARYNWPAMASLPEVEMLLEARSEEVSPKLSPVDCLWAPAIEAVSLLGLDPGVVDEAWAEMKDVDKHATRVWLRTSLTSEELRDELARRGWTERYGLEGVLQRPLDADELKRVGPESVYSDQEARQRILRSYSAHHHRVVVLPDGWVEVTWPFCSVFLSSPLVPLADPKELPWAAAALLDLPRGTLAVLGLDVPGNEASASTPKTARPPEEDEERELTRRLGALRTIQSDALSSHLADFVLTLGEVDGGFVLDIDAKQPPGIPPDETVLTIELGVALSRISVLFASPGLAQELKSVRYRIDENSVHADLVVSAASVHDALEHELDRLREIADINERLRDIERARALAPER